MGWLSDFVILHPLSIDWGEGGAGDLDLSINWQTSHWEFHANEKQVTPIRR